MVIVISNVEGLGHSLWCLFVRIMMGLYIIKAFKLFFWMLKNSSDLVSELIRAKYLPNTCQGPNHVKRKRALPLKS